MTTGEKEGLTIQIYNGEKSQKYRTAAPEAKLVQLQGGPKTRQLPL